MEITMKNNYDEVLQETIALFWKYGSFFIDTNTIKEQKEIDPIVGTIEGMRSQGRGPAYVKFGCKGNSPVRYRIDHIAAYKCKIEYKLDQNKCKEVLRKALLSRGSRAKLYSTKETALLYAFGRKKLSEDLKTHEKLEKERKKKRSAEDYPLVAPKYERPSKKRNSTYHFDIDDILDHICSLTYAKTVPW